MKNLGEKQKEFTRLVAMLIDFAYSRNYALTFGEAYRTPEQAALNAKKGTGIANSLHTQRLAIDLNLFKNGKYCTDSRDYEVLGQYWESLGSEDFECCWGGRFRRPDGNHFSISHNGTK